MQSVIGPDRGARLTMIQFINQVTTLKAVHRHSGTCTTITDASNHVIETAISSDPLNLARYKSRIVSTAGIRAGESVLNYARAFAHAVVRR
ncbi:hypothetical protein GQ602_002802 [Ophiocordyceps camponoti-floridani]|uniref:Uncharacterized protein n=1 Tax=Ophiocordyceps camponoti-floridani TaxID=2030778 RepID=A0A8H4QB07_9HYPO|nr:hypothetical protein GQ602_002802 [Ophiocordyceps camponoti-floridani]